MNAWAHILYSRKFLSVDSNGLSLLLCLHSFDDTQPHMEIIISRLRFCIYFMHKIFTVYSPNAIGKRKKSDNWKFIEKKRTATTSESNRTHFVVAMKWHKSVWPRALYFTHSRKQCRHKNQSFRGWEIFHLFCLCSRRSSFDFGARWKCDVVEQTEMGRTELIRSLPMSFFISSYVLCVLATYCQKHFCIETKINATTTFVFNVLR